LAGFDPSAVGRISPVRRGIGLDPVRWTGSLHHQAEDDHWLQPGQATSVRPSSYAWELRREEEIGPDFTVAEPDSDEVRASLLAGHEAEAQAIEEKEADRRERKARAREEEGTSRWALGEADGEPW
jgi:hypothetical protein